MRRIIVILVVLVGVVLIGWFGYRQVSAQQQAATLSSLQTVAVQRGGLTATVGATGIVRANQSALLSWQTSAYLDKVNVEVGDLVNEGQVLSTLKQSSLPQNIILAQADLISARQALDDLQNSETSKMAAYQALSEAEVALIEAERAMDPFKEKKYKDDLDRLRDDLLDAEEDLEDAQDDLEPYLDRDEDNSTRKNYQQRLDDAQVDYDEAVRALRLKEIEKEQAQANLDLAKATLADAQREYDRVKNGPDPDEVANLNTRIAAAEATLALASMEAPFSGTITEVHLKAGDHSSPGTVAFRLDDLSHLLVDVRVSEVDINRIEVGQTVNLSFDAILGKEYHGQVIEVSPVGVSTQGVVDFTVTVELTDADSAVKPGMTAAVNVVVNQLDNVVLVPNRAVRLQDGRRVVYVLRDGNMEQVEVNLGASSDTSSEVLDGNLRVGDQVVLNPPVTFDQNGPPAFVRR